MVAWNGAAAGPSAANDKWDAFSGAMEEPHGDAGRLAQLPIGDRRGATCEREAPGKLDKADRQSLQTTGVWTWFTLLALVLCLHVPAPVDVSVPEWASFDFPGPSASPSSPSGILKQAAITCDHGDCAVLVMLHSDLRCCLVVLVGPFRSAGGRASEEPAGDMFADFPAPMPARWPQMCCAWAVLDW